MHVLQVVPLFNMVDDGFADKLVASVKAIPSDIFYHNCARSCSTYTIHYILGTALVKEFRAMVVGMKAVRFNYLYPHPSDILEAVFYTEDSDWYGAIFVPLRLQELWPEREEPSVMTGRCRMNFELLDKSAEYLEREGFSVFYVVVYVDPREPLLEKQEIRGLN